jgi:parallel beta-helix repeat protein
MINVKSGTALIDQCVFYGNNAANTDAVDYDNLSHGTVKGCYILDFTGSNSDGIDLGEGSKNILIEGNFINNCSDKGVSVGQASSVTLINNIITHCTMGAGIKDSSSYANIVNNTLYKNDIGVACYEKNAGYGYGNADVVNTVLSMCDQFIYICDERATLTFSYSLSDQMVLTGTGNILANPSFLAPDKMNFFLTANSPCINAGDPSSPKDPDGSRADIGAKYIPYIEEIVPVPDPVLFTKFIGIYPNPVRRYATISFRLKDENTYKIKISLFNPQGRIVREVMNTRGYDGLYNIRIDTRGYGSGLYFLTIEAGSLRKICRIVLLK